MIYHFLYPLNEVISAFNVFRYITFRTIYASLTAFLICFLLGPWVTILILADAGVSPTSQEEASGVALAVMALALKKNLGDRVVMLVARKNGRIVGITIHMRNSSAMHLKFVGIANDMIKSREGLYFNITFSRLIERACSRGIKQL